MGGALTDEASIDASRDSLGGIRVMWERVNVHRVRYITSQCPRGFNSSFWYVG